MLAACWRMPVAPAATSTPNAAPIRARLHASELYGTAALADGGVVVLDAVGTACPSPERSLSVTRFDAGGRVAWVRCLPSSPEAALVAASVGAIWIVRRVDPNAPDHVHRDLHDLAVVDRLAFDGAPIETRVIAVWRDEPGAVASDRLAYLRANMLWLNAARIADDTLLLGGSSSHGRLVDGRWEVHDPSTGAPSGFVLAFPAAGPPRAVIDEPYLTIEDLDVARGWYAAGGRCWLIPGQPTSQIVTCPRGTAAFVIEGQLAAARPSQVHPLEMEYQNLHVAIDAAGEVIVVAASLNVAMLGGKRVASACGSPYAIAASWTRDGALRFARALGDCRRPGGERARPVLDVFDVTFLGDRPVIALFVRPDPDSTAPIQFDDGQLAVEYAGSSIVLELDPSGHVARYRKLRFTGRPARAGQPDGSLASDAGVRDVALAVAGSRVWIAVAHTGSLEDAGQSLLLAAEPDPRQPCDPKALVGPPLEGVDPYDQDECRRTVVLERAIEMIAW